MNNLKFFFIFFSFFLFFNTINVLGQDIDTLQISVSLDSTDIDPLKKPAIDSIAQDTLKLPSSYYLGGITAKRLSNPLNIPYSPLVYKSSLSKWLFKPLYVDSTSYYSVSQELHKKETDLSLLINIQEYNKLKRESILSQNWQTLSYEKRKQDRRKKGLLDFNIKLPSSDKSVLYTIFGTPQISISLKGSSNIKFGIDINKNENIAIPEEERTQIIPTFDQELRLNLSGKIGDKLNIKADWDTKSSFDFENKIKINYRGYEDDIIKSISLGNVSMRSGNSLISGGGSLFGIHTELQFGNLRVQTVLSQKTSEYKTQTLKSGSQENNIKLKPSDYEDDKHFFMDFYYRQEYEKNMSDPRNITQPFEIVDIYVWALNKQSTTQKNERQAVAVLDYGVVQQGNTYSFPNINEDIFMDTTIAKYRNLSQSISPDDLNIPSEEFVSGFFVPLQEGIDYYVNRILGYVTMTTNVQTAIAVSFSYIHPITGQLTYAGDIEQGSNERIFLKLVRPLNVTTENRAWDLTLRNIYSLGVNNVNRDNIELAILYTENTVDQDNLPNRNTTLLQDLGLDRLDSEGEANPDNILDVNNITFIPFNGNIVFPYLEPFGDRMDMILRETGVSDEMRESLVFPELYTEKKEQAKTESQDNLFAIDSKVRGITKKSHSLGFSLAEGSVKVFVNNIQAVEGQDYVVDYAIGTIIIINDKYLLEGNDIVIEYERNQLFNVSQVNFFGVRGEYRLGNNFRYGLTYVQQKERPNQDKINVGNEAISNSLWGGDLEYKTDVRGLTKFLNKLPFFNISKTSKFSIKGEFAYFQPKTSLTRGLSRVLKMDSVAVDETKGVSFIDDFDNTDYDINLRSVSRWNLMSSPDLTAIRDSLNIINDIETADLRGDFSWYTIPFNVNSIIGNVDYTPESRVIRQTEVFPLRDVRRNDDQLLTMDIHYDPTKRGAYNYNLDMRNILENSPEMMWGGMTYNLYTGQEDLTKNNIDYIEFWVLPVLPDGRTPTISDIEDYNGKMYIDLGVISEDIIPNDRHNTEDGLSSPQSELIVDNRDMPRSYVKSIPTAPEGQFNIDNRALEDVGLDGAPSTGGIDNKNEQVLFHPFLEAMRLQYSGEQLQMIENDPSNDDYRHYLDPIYINTPLHERFYRLYGRHENNSPTENTSENVIPITNRPDREGLLTLSSVELTNSYYQYEVDFNIATISDKNNRSQYIEDESATDDPNKKWYLFRIPLSEWKRKFGNINNFQNVPYVRVWFSGYKQPFTVRYAEFNLTGSEWRQVNISDTTNADVEIGLINIEENANRNPIPYRIPRGTIRSENVGFLISLFENEQSLTLNFNDMKPGEISMVTKNEQSRLNLSNYSNLRMFVHGEGYDNDDDVQLVIRFGTDLNNNYYEYRQPIQSSNPSYVYGSSDPDENPNLDMEAYQVWLYDKNSVNIVIEELNKLKLQRDDEDNVSVSDTYIREASWSGAVPGATISIVGNPTITRINKYAMGILNANNDDGISDISGEVWLNELRLTGYDSEGGWALKANTTLEVSDFMTLKADISKKDIGYGNLNSKLGGYQKSDILTYSFSSNIALQKLMGSNSTWKIPIGLSFKESISTPKYYPQRGDILLSTYVDIIRNSDDIHPDTIQYVIDEAIESSQNRDRQYSANIAISKSGSKSKIMQYSLDKVKLNLSYNVRDKSSPQKQFDNSWVYSGKIDYNLNLKKVSDIKPFTFLRAIPLINIFSDTKFFLYPKSIKTSFDFKQSYKENLNRVISNNVEPEVKQTHSFNYNTNVSIDYPFTSSIKMSMKTNSVFNLSYIGFDEASTDSEPTPPSPFWEIFEDVFFGEERGQRIRYKENYTLNWKPKLPKILFSKWLEEYTFSYSGGFNWRHDGSIHSLVDNQASLNNNLKLNMSSLISFIPGAKSLVKQRFKGKSKAIYNQIFYLLRDIILSPLDIKAISVSYQYKKTSKQPGYAGDPSFYDLFKGGESITPSLLYRFGLQTRIVEDDIVGYDVTNKQLILKGEVTHKHNISARTSWEPLKNLKVNFDAKTDWSINENQNINITISGNGLGVLTQSGGSNSSAWILGGSYIDLLDRQLKRAQADISDSTLVIFDEYGNNDGFQIFDPNTLLKDFRETFVTQFFKLSISQFGIIPLPNWKISYNDWHRFVPFLGYLVRSTQLSYNYQGGYNVRWKKNEDGGEIIEKGNLGNYQVRYRRDEFSSNKLEIKNQFNWNIKVQWLISLDTELKIQSQKAITLNYTSSTIREVEKLGIQLSVKYKVNKLFIPFLGRINNRVDINITAGMDRNNTKVYNLDLDLNAILSDEDAKTANVNDYQIEPTSNTGSTVLKGSMKIGYQFSKLVKGNLQYNYRRNIPLSTFTFGSIDHSFLFTLSLSFKG